MVCQPSVTLVIINGIDLHFNCFPRSVSAWIGFPKQYHFPPHGFQALVTRSRQESPLMSVASSGTHVAFPIPVRLSNTQLGFQKVHILASLTLFTCLQSL